MYITSHYVLTLFINALSASVFIIIIGLNFAQLDFGDRDPRTKMCVSPGAMVRVAQYTELWSRNGPV